MRVSVVTSVLALAVSASAHPASLDHLVLGVSDLTSGMEEFEALTGVTPTLGGKHPFSGTHNALVSLGSGIYLEIIAPDPGAVTIPILLGLRSFERLTPLMWAIVVDDARETAAELQSQGHEVFGPAPGSRTQPDGGVLQWEIVALSVIPSNLPFFIEWAEDSAHPSSSAATGCTFDSMSVSAPELDSLRRLLTPLSLPVELETSTSSGLRFTLNCPTGKVEFDSGRSEPTT